jgi:flavin reductase (DIM6/NTAB) family NADH-FMN oxidoreductase RutF
VSEPSIDALRMALRSLTHGVYVVSVRANDGIDCHLVVALAMQVSVEPPRMAFALTHGARVLPALREAQSGVLSILSDGDVAAIRRYGAPGGVKHAPADVARDARGHPVPPEARRWLTFDVWLETVVGDHVLFVANVTGATIADGATQPFVPLTLGATGFPYAG